MIFVKIDKREARARYDRGERIGMAAEAWWFDQPRESGYDGFTKESMGGWTFDELHNGARSDSRFSYAKPLEG